MRHTILSQEPVHFSRSLASAPKSFLFSSQQLFAFGSIEWEDAWNAGTIRLLVLNKCDVAYTTFTSICNALH